MTQQRICLCIGKSHMKARRVKCLHVLHTACLSCDLTIIVSIAIMSPSLRSKDPKPQAPKTHVLKFEYDDDSSCALTVRVNDARFHIVVDPKTLDSTGTENEDILEEYLGRIASLRKRDGRQEPSHDRQDDSASVKRDSKSETESPHANDSAVDLSEDNKQLPTPSETQRAQTGSATQGQDIEIDLQNWMLACFAEETEKHTSMPAEDAKPTTLNDWYNTPVHFYELITEDSTITPRPLDETPRLRKAVDDLFPSLPVPKALRSLGIPMLPPSDIMVQSTSSEPPPIHPAFVTYNGTTKLSTFNTNQFFKPVDPTQPTPTLREIRLLHTISKKNLHSQIKCPQLLGLVSAPHTQTSIMGLLLTAIPSATPLTILMDSEVSLPKRQKWGREASRIVSVLHSHNIVWGDAKGDNFMVDENDELWIIDFGGSFTEGWVEEKYMETEEGDDMGVGKVREGLRDPDGFTFDPEEEGIVEGKDGAQKKEEAGQESLKQGTKRAREDDQDEEKDEEERRYDAPKKSKR